MRKKILAFGASSSVHSINKILAKYAADQVALKIPAEVQLLDLNDFEVPLFSVDRELQFGLPEKIKSFATFIDQSDLVIISLAEHNGSYSTAFKNIYDWTSRIKDRKVFGNKKTFLLATSPGARGGTTVLEAAKNRFSFDGAQIVGSFSLPQFFDHYSSSEGIINPELKQQFEKALSGIVLE